MYEHKPVKPVKEPINAKREDVDLIVSGLPFVLHLVTKTVLQVNEFEISRQQAEKVLTEHGGDLTKALRALVNS